jgi:hypothetical protein
MTRPYRSTRYPGDGLAMIPYCTRMTTRASAQCFSSW